MMPSMQVFAASEPLVGVFCVVCGVDEHKLNCRMALLVVK